MSENLPGTGFWGWLGRQIGHVKHAVSTKVEKPAAPAPTEPQPQPQPQAAPPQPPPPPPSEKVVIYRDLKIEEIEHPEHPGVLLRRTIIDEAIADPNKPENTGNQQPG